MWNIGLFSAFRVAMQLLVVVVVVVVVMLVLNAGPKDLVVQLTIHPIVLTTILI